MTARRGAGALNERVGFAKRDSATDGLGGVSGAFTEQFSRAAGVTHLRGGEGVLAARLEGQHTVVIRVRSCSLTRAVTPEWQIEDKRTGMVYAIRDVTPTDDRAYLDFLAQSGVAS